MSLHFILKSKSLALLVLLALALSCMSVKAAWQHNLSEAEILALQLAVTSSNPAQRQADKATAPNLFLGRQVLLVELQEKKSKTAESMRLAEVFVFDYATNTSSVLLLDVNTRRTISSRLINNIHLPLSEREIAVALQRLLEDADVIAALEQEYEQQIGKPLSGLEQLDMKVSIWNPGAGQPESHECHRFRCALVSLFTNSYYNFSVEPVVNLATGNVSLDLVQ